jgi:hypothetical protein
MSEPERERFSPRQVAAAKLHIKLAKKLGRDPDPRAHVIANSVPVKHRLAAERAAAESEERSESAD